MSHPALQNATVQCYTDEQQNNTELFCIERNIVESWNF